MNAQPSWADVQAEIATQADMMIETLRAATSVSDRVAGAAWERGVDRILVVGAGASLHAGQAMRWWLEELTELPCEPMGSLEYVGYGYRRDTSRTLIVVISASGRPSLTLDAVWRALAGPALVVGITDAHHSPFSTDVHVAFSTCSTKRTGWPTQTTTVAMAILASIAVGMTPSGRRVSAEEQLRAIPALLSPVLSEARQSMHQLAEAFQDHHWFGFVGAGPAWGVANDGAMLITMATADGAVALETEEFHHGGQADALIHGGSPVFVVAPSGAGESRAEETVQVIEAAGGRAIMLGARDNEAKASYALTLPPVSETLSPFIYLPPLHWFAYYLAYHKAKSQTQRGQGMLIRALEGDSLGPQGEASRS